MKTCEKMYGLLSYNILWTDAAMIILVLISTFIFIGVSQLIDTLLV